jgi:hypothetical protein
MGWYAADDAAVRPKGTLYFVLQPHGQQMVGRLVGLSYDGKVISGHAAMTHDENQAHDLVGQLCDGTLVPTL